MEKALEEQDLIVAAYNHDGHLMGYALADISPPGVDEVLPGVAIAAAVSSGCDLHAEFGKVLSGL